MSQPKAKQERIRRAAIAAAQRLYTDEGRIEVDETATLSMSDPPDGGTYVQAWVWVDEDEIEGGLS